MRTGNRLKASLAIASGALLAGCAATGGTRYPSPDAAVTALAQAVRSDSTATLGEIFGPQADELISSGDDVEDRNRRQRFLELYDQGHHLEQDESGTATLVVGPDDWPFPVPLVSEVGSWTFDTEAGLDEVINRRIGTNELFTIETCRAIVDAQREYAALGHDGQPAGAYARRFLSRDPPGHDGLYWPTGPDEPPSPLGLLVADAQAEGYTIPSGEHAPQPFHGYLYRMLAAQGPNAPGGAADYTADGRMTRGFAVVAWPVEYGNSGVMSFLVGANGIVYQADLGDDTARVAGSMEVYDPDPRWTICD